MPTAWFICPYKIKKNMRIMGRPVRYCAMDDFTGQIHKDGGTWAESEIMGNIAIVKVRASEGTLQKIGRGEGFERLEKEGLNDSLSDLSTNRKNTLEQKLVLIGYPLSEVRQHLGSDIGAKTLGEFLRFAARRRLKPRYIEATDEVICDGIEQPCRPIDELDKMVK